MLEMRSATESDCWKVFEWRNRPEVYQHGNARPVSREEHAAWWNEMLGPFHVLWIVEPDAGTVRVDSPGSRLLNGFRRSSYGWLSIFLLPEFQGKGHGPAIIKEACKRAFVEMPWLQEIRAAVHTDNEQSMRAFLKAGFTIEMVKQRDAPLPR